MKPTLLIFLTTWLFSCNQSSNSTSNSNGDDDKMEVVKNYFQNTYSVQVSNFTKTDGLEQAVMGTTVYEYYFECNVHAGKDLWICYSHGGGDNGTYWLETNKNYHVTGSMEIQKFESGWKPSGSTPLCLKSKSDL